MAIASLSKFGVPSAEGSGQTLLMPKLKYRFRVTFTNFGVGNNTYELTKQVMTAGRPAVSFENVELSVYNSKINYAGRHTWADVQIVLRDDMEGKVSRLVGEQIQKQFDFLEQSSASSANDYKFRTDIEILDGGNGTGAHTPKILERFIMTGCYLQNTQYQQADYKSSDPLDITLTLKYDNAVQDDGNDNELGIGSAIAQTITAVALR